MVFSAWEDTLVHGAGRGGGGGGRGISIVV